MIRIFFVILFFISVFVTPWWVIVPLGIVLLAYFEAYLSVLLGGLIVDTLFGVPLSGVFGITYFYTAVFVILIFSTLLLRLRLLE